LCRIHGLLTKILEHHIFGVLLASYWKIRREQSIPIPRLHEGRLPRTFNDIAFASD